MTKFRYYKEEDAAEEHGQVHRVFSENVAPYLLRLLGDDDLIVIEGETADEARINAETNGQVFKYKEVGFDDWAEYLPEEWEKNTDEDCFTDPEFGRLSLSDGEPI